jgi:hypothetical protein
MPIGIIQLHMITPVVIPWPPRFLAVERVMGHGLRGLKPVVQLPRALKLVKVFGARDFLSFNRLFFVNPHAKQDEAEAAQAQSPHDPDRSLAHEPHQGRHHRHFDPVRRGYTRSRP